MDIFEKVKLIPIRNKKFKCKIEDFSKPFRFNNFCPNDILQLFPKIFSSKQIYKVVEKIQEIKNKKRKIMLGMGSHPIKTGLNPLIIDLIRNDYISSVSLNGSGVIHDLEIALIGKTSENVEESLNDRNFGFTKETTELINIKLSERNSIDGFGQKMKDLFYRKNFKHKEYSIIYACHLYDIPLTIHVGIGTDFIHCNNLCKGEDLGREAIYDFRKFAQLVSELEGGMFINMASSVIIPEVFLKSINTYSHINGKFFELNTVAIDFSKQQYRVFNNIIIRPKKISINGIKEYITSPVEVVFPLIYLLMGIENDYKKLCGNYGS